MKKICECCKVKYACGYVQYRKTPKIRNYFCLSCYEWWGKNPKEYDYKNHKRRFVDNYS
jgi:hypothetical protein